MMNAHVAKRSLVLRSLGRIALYGFVLNALWEYIQCGIFYDTPAWGFWRHTLWMWIAILGDVLIVLGVAALASLLAGSRHPIPSDRKGWLALLGIGLVAGIILEWAAQISHLWSYGSWMPTIDIFGTSAGVLPILQITMLPALSVYLARQSAGRTTGAIRTAVSSPWYK